VQCIEAKLQRQNDLQTTVDLLNEFAYEIRHADASLSMQKSKQAMELAEGAGYQKGLAAALLNQGFGQMVQASYTAAFQTLHKAASLFTALEEPSGHAHTLYNIGVVYNRIGEYNQALDFFEQSLSLRQALHDQHGQAACHMQLAYIHERFGNDTTSIEYYERCLAIHKDAGEEAGIGAALLGIGIVKQKMACYEEAEAYLLKSFDIRKRIGETHGWLVSMNYIGEFYLAQNKLDEAGKWLSEAIWSAERQKPPFPANLCRLYTSHAKVKMRQEEYNEAEQHLQQALQIATEDNLKYLVYDIHLAFSEVYQRQGDYQRALASYQYYHNTKEEVINLSASAKLKNLELAHQIEAERKEAEIYRLRHIELKKAYEQLERTKEQLVQAEKMAYLGHLTAGIAHEIQNPLNFVNNFSEANTEIAQELLEEISLGHLAEAKQLVEDIQQNQKKIILHGKRASSVVKSMLQHSRVRTGKQVQVNLNALADEYLQLSLQGYRIKVKEFATTVEIDFDKNIPEVTLVPQDIGRVLLNLYDNAFYAVNKKKEQLNGSFVPMVEVTTKCEGDYIVIIIKDNGVGMPAEIADKIFQPFFTTKPTGEGTGLGLSLSYDIIINGYGGTMSVQSKEGKGSTFVVQLPINLQ
jgi:signal transduction histidine kinase